MKNTQEKKRKYEKPVINKIILDNEISLVMLTLPPDDGVSFRPGFMSLIKLKLPF